MSLTVSRVNIIKQEASGIKISSSASVKDTFNASYLNLGDLSKYNVRKYITKGGDEVFFLCHEEINPNIIAEREKSFVVISGLGDLLDVSDVNDESLELFADAFDFSAIP